MALEVELQTRETEVVGKGTIDGIVPFYFKDQGHRWMVRIGGNWILKERETTATSGSSLASARNKMYWAVAQFRLQSRERPTSP